MFKIAQWFSGNWRALDGGENLMALMVAGCAFKDGVVQGSEAHQEVAAAA